MSKPVVHMIGQAHLDPVWLWRWTEGRAEALGTSQSAVDRLGEYPDFHFTRGESQVYAWIEAENPGLFQQIKRLIANDRWHVVNGMVIQPDMNLPSGESFIRQVLLGKRYMRERLGTEPTIAYCVDSFGHAGTLPQILCQCGFDGFVFMRPGPHEKELPANVFWWEGPDGSRILTFRIAGAYTTWSADQEAHIQQAVNARPATLDATMCFFGVGNHGGGPTKAQIEDVQAIAARRADLDIRFSWPDAFFAAIRPQAAALPTVAEELQFHAVGCYSVNSALKQAHRRAENALLTAERLTVQAQAWAGGPAPQERLTALWHTLCFNQFHDTLGGSSVKQAEDDAIAALNGVTTEAQTLCDDAARAVASRIDTSGPGGALVVFNPAAQPVMTYIEYEPWTGWQPWDACGWSLVDEAGQPVTYQCIDPHEALSGKNGVIVRLLFRVELPACGYRMLRMAPDLPRAAVAETGLRVTESELENDLLAVRLDPASGAIVSCIDKQTGLELVGLGGWNVGQVLDDPSDTWSHGVQRYDQVIGYFGGATIAIQDNGPLQVSLLVERSYGANRWQQQIVLRAGERALTIRNWLLWTEPWRMVKLACDANTAAPVATHDVPFGAITRPCDGKEVPTHMWMDVSGPAQDAQAGGRTVGLALLNDGKYGCDVTGSTQRLTILRCTPYAYHEPHPFGVRARYDWVDMGSQEFTVVLVPHVGDWQGADVVQQARALNLPPLPVTVHAHPGELPRLGSLLKLDNPAVELTTCKQAEDGDGTIVRLAEAHGRNSTATLTWQGQDFAVTLRPFEVRTLRLRQSGGRWTLLPCDMLERSR